MKKMADEEDSREEKRNREEEEYAKLMVQKREMRERPPLALNTKQDSISTRSVQFHVEGGGGVDERRNSRAKETEYCVADVDEKA